MLRSVERPTSALARLGQNISGQIYLSFTGQAGVAARFFKLLKCDRPTCLTQYVEFMPTLRTCWSLKFTQPERLPILMASIYGV